MSGTSLDGVDVALLATDGEVVQEFGPSLTVPYSEEDRRILRRAAEAAATLTDRMARPGVLAEAEELVTARHADAVEAFLRAQGVSRSNVDIVGFHGQTVFHDPARRLTVQIGNGQQLADRLQLPVAWDMRADDMEAGGQGAPLAPVFHRALAVTKDVPTPLVLLNLGGVANLTYVGPDGALLAFDTGPGNGMLDDWVREKTGRPFDEDGALAAEGTPSTEALEGFLAHGYFAQRPPKSLDRNAFALAPLAPLSPEDGAATLLQFSTLTVAAARRFLPQAPLAWYVCGGGRHNSILMEALGEALGGTTIQPIDVLGVDGDAIEAQAFAFLAVRTLDRLPLTLPETTGVAFPCPGGRLSLPKTFG